ncbi:hypothetical protein [Parabacteroides sp. AM08-6]|uniref:hypothetical protein n=1 Tax=Parabacteroides sp. AM08-6 TaxID=2292053 RepID=UPI000EFE8632|nr:hypothetical protein [Parabacteroides sp. AM08-6]RHJ85354.1 hypothetical protein DW103_03895 [Parabacteroides sp. AM08-6]
MEKRGILATFVLLCAIIWCCSSCHFDNATITFGEENSSNKEIILIHPDLDSMWKPTYQYAVIIPADTTLSTYHNLIQLLKTSDSYTKDNAFVICRENDKKSIKEIVPGYSIFISDIVTQNQYCQKTCIYTAKKKNKKYLLQPNKK